MSKSAKSLIALAFGTLAIIFILAKKQTSQDVKTAQPLTREAPLVSPVRIAILDTGLETGFPFAELIDRNLQEVPSNLKDDDNNGLIDDSSGWNFYFGSNDLKDESGHGTTVATVVVEAFQEFSKPKSEPRSELKILPIKIVNNESGLKADGLAKAISYALDRGAKILVVSFGVTEDSAALSQAMYKIKQSGAFLVVAAGHGIANPFVPVSLEKIHPQSSIEAIVVGATSQGDEAEPLSNFSYLLDASLIPPLGGQFSTSRTRSKGSSFAAAWVAGAIAAQLSQEPSLTPLMARARLRKNGHAPKLAEDIKATGISLVEPEKIDLAPSPAAMVRLIENEAHLSVTEEITGIVAELICGDHSSSLAAEIFPKGRAVIRIGQSQNSSCTLSARISQGALEEKITVPVN